jgi:hypothetical protein
MRGRKKGIFSSQMKVSLIRLVRSFDEAKVKAFHKTLWTCQEGVGNLGTPKLA